MMYTCTYQSPLGRILLSSDGPHLTGLWFEGQKYFGATLDKDTLDQPDAPLFKEVRRWLDAYFAGKKPTAASLPLAPKGSAFRQSVWKILLAIPSGELLTYNDIARQLNCQSARAVGGAVGHNPVSIIIPCHRVVGSSGSLTGYAGGLDRKTALLNIEGARLPPKAAGRLS